MTASMLKLVVAIVLLSSRTSAFDRESLFLDSFEVGNDGMAGPVSTVQILTAGEEYCLLIAGTVSLWSYLVWDHDDCGIPDSAPMYQSPDTVNGQVGADAEAWWADAVGMCERRGHHAEFSVNLGQGFSHLEPVTGQVSNPDGIHTYMYRVTGQGSAASFGYRDVVTDDNYGMFLITVASWNAGCSVSMTESKWSAVKGLFR